MAPENEAPERPAPEEPDADDRTEVRYRRGIGITLALLALLGAWIAVMATNAGTRESTTTRQATRIASEAQTAAVVAQGADSALEQVAAEIAEFGSRRSFQIDNAAVAVGIELDPVAEAERLAEARADLDEDTATFGTRRTELTQTATALSLEQTALVAERITWNNRASQYETVLTVLAVAIFLVGFTMVVSRGLRPPFVIPGVVLAIVCFGWTLQIWAKPIPTVAPDAVTAAAAGQVAIEEGRPDDAVESFSAAVEAQENYSVAHRGLGTAILLTGNPDLLTTWAITDDSDEITGPATAELERALELGGRDDPLTVATAAIIAVAASDWDRAAELLDEAIEKNERTPGLQLTRSAVAIAQGDSATAEDWLQRAAVQMEPLAGTDTDRALAAQYLTLLEWVARQEPDQAPTATEFRDLAMQLIATNRANRTPTAADDTGGPPPPDAAVDVETLRFVDDVTTVDLAIRGVPADNQVIVAVYERPSPGGPWVQPAELFYVGPPTDGAGITFRTPRACDPVEYRIDLFVNGAFADTTTAPGVAPTC